MKLNSYSATFT